MRRFVHFRVSGRFDLASRQQLGTMSIDRRSGMVTVRPLRRRRVYAATLSALAELVVRSQIVAEVRARRQERQARRRGRA